MTANMYRVGDYVYFETSSTSPYQIRRIEELNKTPNGNVEAKVMCFFRRRDLPNTLIMLADKHQMASSDESPVAMKLKKMWLKAPVSEDGDTNIGALDEECESQGREKEQQLNGKQRHQLKHRELFLSRQVETLPATHIRGKCSVTLLNETESLLSYLNKDDTFFYCLVFDPTHKTLLADKGEIRVGSRYQADPPQLLLKEDLPDNRNLEDLETLVWTPSHHLTDRQIDQFLVISRSVGTFARALDCSSSVKQPSLHMSAAAASRDITLFHAMDTLHKHSYNMAEAISSLVPSTGPVLCRDEMEEWSASEANLFEEALEKYGKDFNDIRQDFLPWKTLKNIIEYYYMWKTTDRYVQQKRVKAVEAESKLKQVYIPNYNKPNPAIINNNKGIVNGNSNGDAPIGGKACESCSVTISSQWYAWGPSHMQCKLCHNCWLYWKKYGGLKVPSRIGENDADNKKKSGSMSDDERLPSNMASHRPHRCSLVNCGKEFKLKAHLARHYATAHGLAIRSGSPRPIMKTRTAFYLCTTPLTRISRRLCRHLIQPRHAARAPFWPINVPSVKQECQVHMAGKSLLELKDLLRYRKKERGSVTHIANRLGQSNLITPDWLILTAKDMMPKPEHVSFPKPPKAPDGTLLYERVPNKPEAEKAAMNNISPSLLKRRAYEEVNGMDGIVVPQPGPPAKRPNKEVGPIRGPEGFSPMMGRSVINHLNGKAKIATMTRSGSGRKQVISWMDAPDDVYFRSTDGTKKMRRQLTGTELRRAARKPWRKLNVRGMDELVVILD
ncbi:metastasis-associated protein MTA3 isoform X2 [Zootermopsis nevadensis]|uniref:metastasis-associated protein MTA3 isoform X2 n=1 Tax=Zootermopsis nevadensis TaxID=136037 RepID=UPI000B8E89B4|nr:metastasis-associated protein MTA3 isoform X2 [Zootermopsis nevadensis]